MLRINPLRQGLGVTLSRVPHDEKSVSRQKKEYSYIRDRQIEATMPFFIEGFGHPMHPA
jgi:hypothetical protein